MLLRRLRVSGLLSFGPKGIDLPLKPLNVLIGPNGSGKSNLLEILALLRATPRGLLDPVRRSGVGEWFWKGRESSLDAAVDAVIHFPVGTVVELRHILKLTRRSHRFEVTEERIERSADGDHSYYCFQNGDAVLNDEPEQGRHLDSPNREESILAQLYAPGRYPHLQYLQASYRRIRLHRRWDFGPASSLRDRQSADGPSDMLLDGGDNLALVLSGIKGDTRRRLLHALRDVYDGVIDYRCQVDGGYVSLFIEEQGDREIAASRLSDGTLRYMSLLAILLDPNPPLLVAIEEPELGLHPDIIPTVAELLLDASRRMQLVVTTHSRSLIDSLSDHPSSVVVCEQEDGESRFERLDGDRLKVWLDEFSLGKVWSMGELGGNRW
ncbi:MAG: AAA family ATPase [Spirochaetaceae bacterium]|nr:AAA family ATPase [Spirochaetaceae bacterium]